MLLTIQIEACQKKTSRTKSYLKDVFAGSLDHKTNREIYTFKAEKSQSTKFIFHVHLKHATSTMTGNGQTITGKTLLNIDLCTRWLLT